MNTGKTYERANECGTVTRTNPRTGPPLGNYRRGHLLPGGRA